MDERVKRDWARVGVTLCGDDDEHLSGGNTGFAWMDGPVGVEQTKGNHMDDQQQQQQSTAHIWGTTTPRSRIRAAWAALRLEARRCLETLREEAWRWWKLNSTGVKTTLGIMAGAAVFAAGAVLIIHATQCVAPKCTWPLPGHGNTPQPRAGDDVVAGDTLQYWRDNSSNNAGILTGGTPPEDTTAFVIFDSTHDHGTLMRLDHTGRIDTKHSGTVRTREPRLVGHLVRVAVHKDAVCVCTAAEDRLVSCTVRGGALEVLAEGPPVDVRYVCF